jgi:4a-hydroxytetrahydrobiopterin dehydratase
MLAQKKCMPCQGATPLNPSQIGQMMAEIPGWELVVLKSSPAITRRFSFKNFALALEFVNKAGAVAEAENHHPDIAFGWAYAQFTLYTHDINGLHENDFIVAAKINAL